MDLSSVLEKAYEVGKRVSSGRDTIGFTEFCEATLNFKLHDWQKIVTERLGRLDEEEGARIIIHAPPQYGKSIITSQRLPAWLMGRNPLRRVGLACYNISHASNFGDVVKNLMVSPEYDDIFPRVQMPRVASGESFALPARKSLSDGTMSWVAMGLLTGFVGRGFGPGDCLIIDDPYASPDQALSEATNEAVWRWWAHTAKVRVDAKANVVVFFHRYHEDDFAGRLIAEGGWEQYRFPAIADDGENDPTGRKEGELLSPMRTREFLETLRERDPQMFLGQFQGRPRPVEGAFIKREWLREESDPPKFHRVCRFWDLAVSTRTRGDYTAGALVGFSNDQTVWLLDMVRFRAEWPEACTMIATISEIDYARYREMGTDYCVGVERVAWQSPMIQDLFQKAIYQRVPLWPLRPERDKKARASGWVARAAHGKFAMLRNPVWNAQFVNEAVVFDGLGLTHDDQIDAVSGAYALLWALAGSPAESLKLKKYTPEWYDDILAKNRLPDEYVEPEDEDSSDETPL